MDEMNGMVWVDRCMGYLDERIKEDGIDRTGEWMQSKMDGMNGCMEKDK